MITVVPPQVPAVIVMAVVAVVVTDFMVPIFVGLCGTLQASERKHTDNDRTGEREDCPAHCEPPEDEGSDVLIQRLYGGVALSCDGWFRLQIGELIPVNVGQRIIHRAFRLTMLRNRNNQRWLR
jgi:hypothetical protein